RELDQKKIIILTGKSYEFDKRRAKGVGADAFLVKQGLISNQVKFLQEVISAVAGKQAEGIGEILYNSKHVNEFLIAKKLDLTINQTRNILYKISDQGLVSSIRKKDKKKGWYTYFWKIEVVKSLEFLRNVLLKQINQISNQIKSRETKEFYICERCNIEFNQENALLYDFTCNECGGIFSLKDNTKVIKDLRRETKKLEDELKLVEEELAKETAKVDKQKTRELKKIKEKKSIEKKSKTKKKTTKKEAKGIKKILKSVKKVSKMVVKKKKSYTRRGVVQKQNYKRPSVVARKQSYDRRSGVVQKKKSSTKNTKKSFKKKNNYGCL
ncbi:MAG: hypothetical protein KKF67_03870, partial [Nanoarchaeota archaeon]|nr:hypothetical protein [Nanoarchaeota archaeon]